MIQINNRREIKEIDILRQIINQETLIRVSVVKDVRAVVDDVRSLKQSMASTKSMLTTLQRTLELLKKQVDSLGQDNTLSKAIGTLQKQVDNLSQDNSLQQRVETLQRQMENVIKNNSLKQTVETLKSQISYLRQDNSLHLKIETLQGQVDSLKQENRRITKYLNKIRELDEMFKILKENISDIYDDVKGGKVQINEKGLKQSSDCKDHFELGQTLSGLYTIYPFGNNSQVRVYCDMVTDGGGWTAIQKRSGGSVTFNRMWAEYKKGFGNLSDIYWIGNDVIHQLTKENNSALYLSITLRNGTTLYERYHQFSVSDESDNYRLYLGGPATGTLGDRMLDTGRSTQDLSGMSFSTPDRDHDRAGSYNCAVDHGGGGGWWYNNCHDANLNGPWSPAYWWEPWFPLLKNGGDITETLMMIKSH
ncbi:fibrinogen-like protein 1 isoform X1 [Saccostrea cucullata]|uniref:fibrinogen-like protein 1 isoform X1 n=1 Tax=Saccostrea cuccullata TaxID=36930 RepID=UPI002ED5A021